MNQAGIGVVIIGRNEGTRLHRCIESVKQQANNLVYVDSGSTDDSVAYALSMGCEVVELDMNEPFTAGKARNAGTSHLLQTFPHLEHIQFIDGDCTLAPHWLTTAADILDTNPQVAVVCGRRRERHPDASIYNTLCDLEWDTPIGEALACGGDSLVRVTALQEMGGFDPSFAAGEEPELCYRMRQQGWKIRRIDAEMTLHDAAMTSFSQWWRRTLRSGSAYAQSTWQYGTQPERFGLRESVSIWLWAGFLPLIILILLIPTRGLSLLLLAGYPFLAWRIYRYMRSRGTSQNHAILYAASCVAGKFPQLLGQSKFYLARQSSLIEYK
jgi:GT2 family glycosyltransferase